ncbi:Interferon-induced protein 44-like, partial [Entomortierella beljakovae]
EEKVVMHAHSLILQARSSYFARALNSEWKEASQGVIHKPNITPAVFEKVLQYIYGGRLTLEDEIVAGLIRAADELCMEDLLVGCERYALTTIRHNNVMDMVNIASLHNLTQLKSECMDFIASNIGYLKKGKAILTLDADVLKEIFLMDQLDLDELEIWKIAIRWSFYQQGLNWEQCPLLDFPKGPGCVIVRITKDSSSTLDDDYEGSDDEVDDSIYQMETDEDKFRPRSQSVFHTSTNHNVIELSEAVHDGLSKQIKPILSAIRFMRIPSVDFLRLVEGTGLLPVALCAKVYRYHSVPSMADPYQTSLRRRMAFSTVLGKEHLEIVIGWLQSVTEGSQSPSENSNYAWSRRNAISGSSSNNPLLASSSNSPLLASSSNIPFLASSSNIPLAGFSPTGPLFAPGYFPPGYSPPTSSPITGMPSPSPSPRQSRIISGSLSSSLQNISKIQQEQPPRPKLKLQYRASRDGFDASNFHMACDQRGPTLTVVRAENGTIFGGYNSSSWSSHPTGVYSTSRTNFLFTLNSREHPQRENIMFPVKGDGLAATYNKLNFGPTFGTGHDLFISSNCNLSSQSSSLMPTSYGGSGASATILAGSSKFRVQEYEVFLVQ